MNKLIRGQLRENLFGALGKRQAGVTLVELVISIVILSIAMVTLLNAFGTSVSQSSDPLWRNKTLKLAQLYLDEILAKNYDHNTPVGGLPIVSAPGCNAADIGPDSPGGVLESRETYNDVDDYDGLTQSPPSSLVAALDSSYDDYSVAVSVACDGDTVDAEDTGGTVSDNHAKKITVTITAPNSKVMTFATYKGNY